MNWAASITPFSGRSRPRQTAKVSRQPDDEVHPDRRAEGHLGEERAEGDEEARDQDHEDRRTIARSRPWRRSKPQASQAGADLQEAFEEVPSPQFGQRPRRPASSGLGLRIEAPGGPGSAEDHVDEGEQEQPHHVDEVPVPGRRLEAEVLSAG